MHATALSSSGGNLGPFMTLIRKDGELMDASKSFPFAGGNLGWRFSTIVQFLMTSIHSQRSRIDGCKTKVLLLWVVISVYISPLLDSQPSQFIEKTN